MTFSASSDETLLGRERDVREAFALIREAHSRGEPAIIRVAGPPGIGKTMFLQHIALRGQHSKRTLWIAAEPDDRATPASTIRRLTHMRPGEDAGVDEIVMALRPSFQKKRILCVDDAQWIDEISRQILVLLMREHGASLTMVFGDRRESAPELMPHRSIHLGPLRRSAAAQLVRRYLTKASRTVVNEIVETTSGIPFAVVFVAQHAAAPDRPGDASDDTVVAVIARRLAHSSERARETVRYCAHLNAPVDLHAVSRALGASLHEVVHALHEFADLATVDGVRVSFRHATIEEAVRSTVADSVPYYQRLLHAFDIGDDRPDVLALRLRCAQGCGDDATAAACALRLGRILAAASSLETALEYITLALQHAERPLSASFALEYAGVLLQLYRHEQAAAFLREQLRGAFNRGDAADAAELLTSFFSAALTLEQLGEFDASCDRVERMPSATAKSSERVRSARLAALAFSGNLEEYDQRVVERQLAWVDRRPASFVAALRGDDAEARRLLQLYQSALRSEHARQEPTDRVLSAMIALFETGTVALSELDEIGRSVRAHPSAAALRILQHIARASWDGARAIVEAVPLWEKTYTEQSDILGFRLLLAGIAGHPIDEESRTLRTIREQIGRRQIRHAVVPARWYVAYAVRTQRPPPADIDAFVRDTLDVAPMPYVLSGIPLSVALLAPLYGAPRCAAGIERWPMFGSRWHRAHFELAYGLLTHDHQRLRKARDAFDALNAPAFAAIAGVALPVPRARDNAVAKRFQPQQSAETPRPLTARERDVAELAATGKGNREIAATLHISERTVEVHLTNAYRKLGVSSRSALAQWMIQPGNLLR